MKTLVSVAFAIDLDENELVEFVRTIDQSIYDGIKSKLPDKWPDGVTSADFDELIDWYGATFTPRRDLGDMVEEMLA